MKEDILIGRTESGERVYVSARFDRQSGDWQTVEHETVSRPLTVAFQGVVIRKGGRYGREADWEAFGQIDRSYLRSIIADQFGWSVEDVRKLADIWDEWHLNTMQAGCVHQPAESIVYRIGQSRREVDLKATPACPETGYRWGSAWLTRPLPDDVAAWVSERFGIEVPK